MRQAAGRALVTLAVAVATAGCVVSGAAPQPPRQPVPAGPLGPIIPNPNGGPPVECRGLPRDECVSLGDIGQGQPGIDVDQIVRVILTCQGICTPADGEYRIDLLFADGTMHDFGQGGYSTVGAP
jgi:hypothetical protein